MPGSREFSHTVVRIRTSQTVTPQADRLPRERASTRQTYSMYYEALQEHEATFVSCSPSACPGVLWSRAIRSDAQRHQQHHRLRLTAFDASLWSRLTRNPVPLLRSHRYHYYCSSCSSMQSAASIRHSAALSVGNHTYHMLVSTCCTYTM